MDRAREDRWVKYQFLLPMLLLGFNLTSMSIYGSYLISVYIITFFSMVQKGCKCKLNLGKLNAAYMWFGHIQKFALLKKVQSWIPGRVFPLAAVALRVFSMFQDIPGAKCKWVPHRISEHLTPPAALL